MLETIINFFAYGSLLFAASAAYLQLNKLWARKHVAEVAESISIPGILVESVPLFFFGIYFLYKGELLGIIDSVIWLTSAVLVTMIGSGFWVKGERKKGLWKLMMSSMKRERSEMANLAKQVFHPASAPQLIEVLTRMAAVDGDIDQREIDLVQPFAEEWSLSINWAALEVSRSNESRIIEVHKALLAYLDTGPQSKQVAHLLDVLQILVDADDSRSDEEQLAFAEVKGEIDSYLAKDTTSGAFSVVVAPQDTKQDEAIRLLLTNVEPHTYAGGKGYTVGRYFSREYAEIICANYRALSFFTMVTDEKQAALYAQSHTR
ncbi:MAG: hypothetical protein ABJN62_02670 [Halioglobus sp.]